MKSRVQRWGNSLAIRLPKPLAEEVDLAEGTDIDLELKDGTLVISRSVRKRYSLDELIDGITPENLHESVDWGAPIRRENVD